MPALQRAAVVLVCLLFTALAPGQSADRSVLNENLPRWMSLRFESRFRLEGHHGGGYVSANNEDFLLVRNRLSLTFQPTLWLQFTGEGQDARSFGIRQPNGSIRDIFDLRQAYLGIGSESSWFHLRVGRQKIAYGSERVIGAGEWGNTARVFDAAHLSIGRKDDHVDFFAASVVVNDADQWDHHVQGNNLHGVYASFGSLLPGIKLEPFLLYRSNHDARLSHWTGGLRSAGDLGSTWSYETDLIRQRGSLEDNDLSSWATTIQVRRHFTLVPWRPSLIGEFNYASGDRDPSDTVVNTYDPIYPTGHSIYGVADQVGRRNTRNVRGGVWFWPRPWMAVHTEAHSFWLANRYDGLYTFNGASAVPAVPGGARSLHVGKEFDVALDIRRFKHYTLGAQFGYFWSGPFIKQNTTGANRQFYAFYLDFRI